MIEEDYVSFETAKLLKEKGFDENIITYRDDFIQRGSIVIPLQECLSKDKVKTPTLQMAMKWLREKYYCHIIIDYTFKADANLSEEYISYCYCAENAKTYIQHIPDVWYSTYEEACEAAIKYCLINLIN